MVIQYGDVRLELQGEVAEIVWAAHKLNLFSPAVADAFDSALDDLPGEVRALLLRAEGKVFSAGVQAEQFTVMDGVAGTDFSRRLIGLVQRIEALPVPTLAAVHALNLTIGFELTLACDFIWASTDATMGLVEAKVGITPAAGGTQRLVARAGVARATEMVFTGGVYDAQRLHEWGVVDAVHPSFELLTRAREFAADLAAGPTTATAIAKRIIALTRDRGLAAADEATPELTGPVLDTADAKIGVQTLLAHGPGVQPPFCGR